MDTAPPNSKRPPLSSWPAGTPQQVVSLPHPHQARSSQLPPPPAPSPGALHPPAPNPCQHYPSRSAEDRGRPNSTGHAPDGMPSIPHLLLTSHPPPAPPPPGAYPGNQPDHMNYKSAPSMPPTPGSDRAQASYEQQGGYSSGHEPLYGDYSSSILAKKSTRASRVGFDLFKDFSSPWSNPSNGDETRARGGGDYKRAPTSPYPTNGAYAETYYPSETPQDHPSSEHIPLRMIAEDEMEVKPGPPIPPGEPAIPLNHTTLASLLLEWPSIRELINHHLEREGVRHISEYPISQEQNRGVLFVYGRGEDSHPSRHVRELADHGNLDMAGGDSSDIVSPLPASNCGQLSGLSTPDQVEYKGGVLAFDVNPDFSESNVWAYVESFKENILSMHPVIQPDILDHWVRYFLDTLRTRSSEPQTPKPAFAVGGGSQTPTEITGSKRKRSSGAYACEPPRPAPPRTGRPDRSIHSALVLSVLALGKICLHRDTVPDVVQSSEPLPHGSQVTRNGAAPPPPNQGPPPGFSFHSHSSGLPLREEQGRSLDSRRSSIHGLGAIRSGYGLKKNYEITPGLEYFAYATDILGNHTGAYNNMKNVYANVFAGLYHGQLARPMESFAFIHKASHKLQVIMRPSLDKLRRIKRNCEFIQDIKYNQLALTFWTCLQLESDLIAELRLPPSDLFSYEDDMPRPNMSLLEGFNQRVLDSYPGQLYLRTHLNSIHRMFYAPEDTSKAGKAGKDKFRNVVVVSDAVSGMHWVAPSFAFREDDPPADDILAARLRAKYWGAQVITYRPFIRQILQFSQFVKNHASSPYLSSVSSEFHQGIITPLIHPKPRTHSDIDPQVIELAKKGIKALIESTRAFHGLREKRPIITNVFGTAHAQWGNLLVLSAAFKDPVLHSYVDEQLLRILFHKTILFLQQSAAATSSLRTDMHILKGLQSDLFGTPDPRTNSSFPSGTSALGYHIPRPAAPPQMPHPISDQVLPQPMLHRLQMTSWHEQ
ncbi:hypothetical protein MRS44_017541 [Fusarium solani]|uniref:uncharacterized protein n=1 Tax=Fusarium solani TaxID=169388 RepID=UPI0032C4006D|nr:hypothetical protein MRS44_017541 [Fusarium solani]